MTEENKDSTPPKLRLSSKPKEPETKEAAAPKPDLSLTRPPVEPEQEQPKVEKTTPLIRPPAEETPSEGTEKSDFDPKNPFHDVVDKPAVRPNRALPPELPGKPAPTPNNGASEKFEEAIGQVGEVSENEEKSGLLTSLIVILILLALLGGSGYGLYYLLRSPNDVSEVSDNATGSTDSTEDEAESGGLISGAIKKAKATIAKVPDTDSAVEEVAAETEEAAQTEEEPEPEESTATSNPEQVNPVADFLQNAHIGGVRAGDRPKLILNGESYSPGDLVEPDSGLRFIGLRDEKLAFRDAKGIVYIKSF